MKTKILALLTFAFIGFASAQNVNIPDQNFKNYLLTIPQLKTPGLPEITVAKAQAYTGGINCGNKSISDLTGIEAFVNLTILNCSANNIATLDLSANVALQELNCYFNGISNLNISNCTALKRLNCDSNQLTNLDVSNNTALEYLSCYNNQLTSLDVSNNLSLIGLRVGDNDLKSLDFTNNTLLRYIDCRNNDLIYLNFKNTIVHPYIMFKFILLGEGDIRVLAPILLEIRGFDVLVCQ